MYLALHPDLGPDQNGLVNYITIILGVAGAAMTHINLIHKDPIHSLNYLLRLHILPFSEFDTRSSLPEAALYFLQWDGALLYISTFIFGISTMPHLSITDVVLSVALVRFRWDWEKHRTTIVMERAEDIEICEEGTLLSDNGLSLMTILLNVDGRSSIVSSERFQTISILLQKTLFKSATFLSFYSVACTDRRFSNSDEGTE
jgi:hypothetical protein